MKKILIFGGTQYVGRQLVGLLHEKKYDITVASRGNFTPPLGDNIRRVILDRYNVKTYPAELSQDWDIVIDLLAFFPEHVKMLTDYFGNKAKHYVLVSSSAVYAGNLNCTEEEFDPDKIQVQLDKSINKEVVPDTIDYSQGKREAEAFLVQNSQSYSIVRFPKILGLDDLSNRLLELILLIQNKSSIPVASRQKKYSFIHSKDAARFLSWIIAHKYQGIINATSTGVETAESLVRLLGGDTNLIVEDIENELSLFKGEEIVINASKAEKLGFIFENNEEWIKMVASIWRYYIGYISKKL